MNAPKMPGYTCKMIDKLKSRIEEAYDLADNAGSDDVDELKEILRNIRNELHGEADALETIRDANSALRECVHYWENKAEEALSCA